MKSKASNKIIRYLDTGIFPCTVLFSVGFTYDEIIKHLNKTKATEWALGLSEDKKLVDSGNNFALKRTIENNKTGKSVTMFYIILINQFKFTDYEMCKLAHEVLHICQFMLPEMLDMEREYESVAYTHTYLMQSCLKQLRG